MDPRSTPGAQPPQPAGRPDLADDPAVDIVLDANAVAGLLATIFDGDMTGIEGRCHHCGTVSLVGSMRAWTAGPGVVLRCPACMGVTVRIVQTPSGTRIDVQATMPAREVGP